MASIDSLLLLFHKQINIISHKCITLKMLWIFEETLIGHSNFDLASNIRFRSNSRQ